MKMMRKVLLLVLALLLAAAFPMTAAADVWIPPDDNVNEALLASPYFENDCKALNAFVSNYVEANMKEYDRSTPDSAAIAVTLKHLELNQGLFGSDVTSFTGEDGKTYMKVSASIFEARVQKLFGRSIPAENCPGYDGGYIYVSAANFGGPIRVFGSVDYCNYIGDGVYDLQFTVFYAPGGVSNEYSVPYFDIADRGYQEIGTGYCTIYFNDPNKTSFRTADFRLMDFWMDAEGIPCTEPNNPLMQGNQGGTAEPENTEPPQTEPARTEPPETEAPQEGGGKPEEEQDNRTESRPEQTDRWEPDSVVTVRQGAGSMVLVIVLAVVAVSLLALAVILLVFKKKQ